MKRETTQTIWRTVVFAGAMHGAPACTKKHANTTPPPNNTAPTTDGTPTAADPATTTTTTTTTTAPAGGTTQADPCAGADRPRGGEEDGGGHTGRGFVLS